MCPVQCVTYVSGRSLTNLHRFSEPLSMQEDTTALRCSHLLLDLQRVPLPLLSFRALQLGALPARNGAPPVTTSISIWPRLISESGSLLTTIRLTAAFFSPDDAIISQ